MKKILSYISNFIRKDFTWGTYAVVLIFLSTFIALNYYFTIENGIITKEENALIRFLLYLILYSTAYYGTLAVYYFIDKTNYFSNKEVMVKSSLALLLLSFDGAFVVSKAFMQSQFLMTAANAKYSAKLVNQALPTLIYLFFIVVINKKYNTTSSSLYGLTTRGFHWKPYFTMLLLMLPLLLWASFQVSFAQQYPFFKYWNYDSAFGLSQKQLFLIYEFFYLFNFVNVELLFRGLLIIGMIKCMGNKAVLPMIVTYAFLHFGKPTPETISSAIGGYILGIIAYQTKNIFGGLLIHICIALVMDVLAIGRVHL